MAHLVCCWRPPWRSASDPTLLDAAEAGDHAAALRLLAKGRQRECAGRRRHHRGDVGRGERRSGAGACAHCGQGRTSTPRNQFGTSALTEAAIIGSREVIDALLKAGADRQYAEPRRGDAADGGRRAAARWKRRSCCSTRVPTSTRRKSWGGQSALMWAAAQGQGEMVKFLASKGAELRRARRGAPVGAQGHHRAAPERHEQGRLHAAAVCGARRLRRLRRSHLIAGRRRSRSRKTRIAMTPLVLAIMNLHFDAAADLIRRRCGRGQVGPLRPLAGLHGGRREHAADEGQRRDGGDPQRGLDHRGRRCDACCSRRAPTRTCS